MPENIFNVPNILTILRFILSPVFLYLLLIGREELALIIFMFVAVTDLADGWIARSTQTKTKFGESMDPAADKFMVFLALFALVRKYDFPFWAVPIFISRDIVSLCGSIIVYAKHKDNWKPNILGKVTTFLQIATILSFIIDLRLKLIFLYITLLSSFLAAIIYARRGIRILTTPKTKEI